MNGSRRGARGGTLNEWKSEGDEGREGGREYRMASIRGGEGVAFKLGRSD
jgi:hypothetical protein